MKIKRQQKLRNRTLNTIKKYIPKEDIKFIETQMIEESIESNTSQIDKDKPFNSNDKKEPLCIDEKPLFINNYERYEWLIKYGCTNSDDRQWLESYIKSDEYKEIYG